MNGTENDYILPPNLDDSKGQTISTLEGENDDIIDIIDVNHTNSIINLSSSANYSAQFIASLQNIKDIKQKMMGERGNFRI